MTLSANQKDRYLRQIIIEEIGETGQERLLNASALVIGAGGIGSAVSFYLAAAGVGNIGIVDYDRVEISNLQRQILHNSNDIGRPKVDSAREKLVSLNNDVTIITHFIKITYEKLINPLAQDLKKLDGKHLFVINYK